jgi:hypothetical protein
LFGRKNSTAAAQDTAAGQRPRGARLTAEAAVAPGVAVAGQGAAPALRRRYRCRLCGQAHKIPTSSFWCRCSQYRTAMQFTNCYSVA